jgi:hypothetical protein
MDYDDKKQMVLQMLDLHPSQSWYQQCLEMHFRNDELEQLQEDSDFLRDVKSTLFLCKSQLIEQRRKSIDISASKGGWQGLDKLLQEIDRQTFSISRDIGQADLDDDPLIVYLPDDGRGK